MSDVSLSITNTRTNATKTFEANSRPLETKTLGLLNLDKRNDYSVSLSLGNGKSIYLRQDQVDAIRMAVMGSGTRADRYMEAIEGTKPKSITVNLDGQSYNLDSQDVHQQLQGKGSLT